MRKLLALWIAALCAIVGAFQSQAWVAQVPAAVGVYTGVCDVSAHCANFFGVTAAKSGINVAAVDITDNGSNTCTGVKVLTTGLLDTAVGLYCNTASATVASVCGASCTVGTAFHATKLYDQIGAASCTEAYATAPQFILSGFNSKPTLHFIAGSSMTLACTITSINVGWTVATTYSQYAGTNGNTIHQASWGIEESSTTVGQCAVFGATNSPLNVTVAAASGATDFTHPNTVVYALASGGAANCYPPGGGGPTSATFSFTASTGTNPFIGGNSTFSSIQWSKVAFINVAESSANAESITSLAAP